MKKFITALLTVVCMITCFTGNAVTALSTIRGDVNGDKKVDVFDAIAIAQYTVGNKTLTSIQLTAADYNADGSVNVFDAIAIAKTTVKKPTSSSTSKVPSVVYITKTGKRYHYNGNCNGGTYIKSTYKEAIAKGLTPCSKCVK